MNYDLMAKQLMLHEGVRLTPYVDTEGFLTCLVGYNVDSRGWDFVERTIGRKVVAPGGMNEKLLFTRDEALAVLHADILRIERVMRGTLEGYDSLDPVRQRVCLDMAFNLGGRALKFRKAIAAFKQRNWSMVAREMYDSKWAKQVGDGRGGRFDRADRLTAMVLTGQEPSDHQWLQHLQTLA